MKTTPTPLEGAVILEPTRYHDERGFFTERYSSRRFAELGLPSEFAQDNHSWSKPGVLRGMHFQWNPPQGKIVGVVSGRIYDVIVDIRRESKTFGKWFGLELSAENGKMLWIPAGFAHGFCVLGDEPADVLYKADQLYSPGYEGGLPYNDPAIGIDWPLGDPILSEKDRNFPSFEDYRKNSRF